jgi:hypothetical protein
MKRLLTPIVLLAVVPATAHATTFQGTCFGQGHARFAPATRLEPGPGAGELNARITCSGTLDGRAISGRSVAATGSTSGITSCFAPNVMHGRGILDFGAGRKLAFEVDMPLHPAVLLLSGVHGGHALGSAVFVGTDEPLTACATTGVAGATYALAVQTLDTMRG